MKNKEEKDEMKDFEWDDIPEIFNPIYKNRQDNQILNNPEIFRPNFIGEVTVSATVTNHYMEIKVNGKRYKVPLTLI